MATLQDNNHRLLEGFKGWLCVKSGKETEIVWSLDHASRVYCPHCSANTPAKRLKRMNDKRIAQARADELARLAK